MTNKARKSKHWPMIEALCKTLAACPGYVGGHKDRDNALFGYKATAHDIIRSTICRATKRNRAALYAEAHYAFNEYVKQAQ